jgi:histidine triad (HIT) family protein
MSECVFCRIVAGTLPATRVFEDDRCLAFRDLHPAAPTHVLVVPRRHVATMNDFAEADEALLGHLLRTGAEVARTLGLAGSGYRLVLNTNGDGGQTVFHVHLHVLGGRALHWPPG